MHTYINLLTGADVVPGSHFLSIKSKAPLHTHPLQRDIINNTQVALPCMCHCKAPTLTDAFIYQQLSEKAWRVPWRTAGGNFWRGGSVPQHLGKLKFEMHLFFESLDVNF